MEIQYNLTLPTLPDKGHAALQVDANGALIVTTKTPNAAAKTVPGTLTPKGYEQITGLSSVKTLTVPSGATFAVITAETQAVRWRDDGTSPSATVGMPLANGSTLEYNGDLAAIKFFEQAASAKLNVAYYG